MWRQRIVNDRKLGQPGECVCVSCNLICCWQNRDMCSSQTNPYMHARHRSSIKADWFKALENGSSPIPGPALPLLLPWYQIAVIQDGLHWKGKGMFTVCSANAGNILSHKRRGSMSGNDVWTLKGWNEKAGGFFIWNIRWPNDISAWFNPLESRKILNFVFHWICLWFILQYNHKTFYFKFLIFFSLFFLVYY